MEGITYLRDTLTEEPKHRYWRLKAEKMMRCRGCGRRTRQSEICCTAHYLWQNDQHPMISSANGRTVAMPYRKLAAGSGR